MDNIESYMLTTSDNPYNPFIQFDLWYEFDVEKGYNTLSYLARLVITSDEISETDEILANNQAIDSILETNIYGNYVKVTEKTFDSLIGNKLLANLST